MGWISRNLAALQPLDTDRTLRLLRPRFPPPRGWVAVAEGGVPRKQSGFKQHDVDGNKVVMERGPKIEWAWLIRHNITGQLAVLLSGGGVNSVDQRKAAIALALLESGHDGTDI